MSDTFLTHLSCWSCGARHPANRLINVCPCGRPLRAVFDLHAARAALDRDAIAARPRGLWRWRELLPCRPASTPVTLGEGDTPLVAAPRLAAKLGLRTLLIKDESLNPTGSFKARGMSTAVTMARALGATKLAVPSAGNAGGALAAYAAAAGLAAHVFMPRDVPAANRLECALFGANVTLVDGLISDCGRLVAQRAASEGWFDVSTLKEPYRVEGKKTLGYELAEQLGWRLPDVIVYPTGGGTGLIGMGKAFDEMEQMGWIGPGRPRFVVVQSEGCAPVVRAFESGRDDCQAAPNAQTAAAGLRVPKPFADFAILRYLRVSGGAALAVSDDDMLAATRELSAATGICACPEGGACLAALRKLAADGWVRNDETVVLFNTGSGLKYAEALSCVTPA